MTEEDVRFGRQLAQAVARYLAELEKHAVKGATPANPREPSGRAA